MNARRFGLVVLVLGLVGAGVVATYLITRTDQEDIFLEGAGQTGRDPFTTVAQISPTSTTASTGTTVAGDATTTTALFGGSGNQRVCDPEALITFLGSNPDKAAAWVEALNSDTTLQWSGGSKLTVADIPTYIRELTPTFLSVDTRVTNHGYVDGRPTPRQSVLQAGTAVLVDTHGIPRVRCACGNPLLPPEKVDNPNYEGECWPGCHDHPYCSPPDCTEPTTTTVVVTSTTEPATTTSCVPTPGAAGCGPPTIRTTTTRRPPIITTTTRPITTTQPTVTVTTVAATTTTCVQQPGGVPVCR